MSMCCDALVSQVQGNQNRDFLCEKEVSDHIISHVYKKSLLTNSLAGGAARDKVMA